MNKIEQASALAKHVQRTHDVIRAFSSHCDARSKAVSSYFAEDFFGTNLIVYPHKQMMLSLLHKYHKELTDLQHLYAVICEEQGLFPDEYGLVDVDVMASIF